jgi:hypothetical protein
MDKFEPLRAVLPSLPRNVQRLVLNWIARERVPVGVVIVCSYEPLYLAVKAYLAINDSPTS